MANKELIPPYDYINRNVPQGMIWAYEATLRGGRVEHQWTLKNERGGIHIHGFLCEYVSQPGWIEWLGGIECHWAAGADLPEWMDAAKPTHDHCWLLNGPCWHDGTSLGFSETIAPFLPRDDRLEPYHHERVTHHLLDWHRDKFPIAEDAEASQ